MGVAPPQRPVIGKPHDGDRKYLAPDIREELLEPLADQGPLLIEILGGSKLDNLNLTDMGKVNFLSDKTLFGDFSQHLAGDLG